jgi:hypothetical protein
MYDDVVLAGKHFRYLAGQENLVEELKAKFTTEEEHVQIDAFVKYLDM